MQHFSVNPAAKITTNEQELSQTQSNGNTFKKGKRKKNKEQKKVSDNSASDLMVRPVDRSEPK
jgi:hypothetical protein